jgi:hypothetical protein
MLTKMRRQLPGTAICFAAAAALFSLNKAGADMIIVNNLTSSPSAISGIKNAVDTSYAQGFSPTISGDLNSLEMNIGLQQVTGYGNQNPPPPTAPENVTYDTVTLSLWTANSSGDPITEVATLASNITVADIESASGSSSGYTSINDSWIYTYPVTLLSNPAITAGDDYAIEFSVSDTPNAQEIGWGEENGSDSEPTGPDGTELMKINIIGGGSGPGYGRMELDMPSEPTPEPGSLTLLALGGMSLLMKQRRRKA